MGDPSSLRQPHLSRRQMLAAVGGFTSFGSVSVGSSKTVAADAGDRRWAFNTGNEVRSSPTVVDGTVFVGSNDNNLYAVDTETGTKKWEFNAGGSIRSSPTVVDGIVFVGSGDGNLYAVDAETGRKEWELYVNGTVHSSPTIVDGTVFVGSNGDSYDNGYLSAVNAELGTQEWAFETDGNVRSSPTVVGGTVYVGSDDANIYAVNMDDGTEEWSFSTGADVRSSPTVVDETLFVGSTDHNLYAIDITTGTEQWIFETVDEFKSSPTVSNGRIFIGNHDNYLYSFDKKTGDQLWDVKAGDNIISSPTVVNETVFFASGNGNVFALDAETEETKWVYRTLDTFISSPTVANGIVFIGGTSGILYALTTGISGHSDGSRMRLGTLGHHGDWEYDSQSITIYQEEPTRSQKETFSIEAVNPSLETGESRPIEVQVTNNRNQTLTDIEGKFLADDPIGSSTKELSIRSLEPGETATVTVNASVAPNASIEDQFVDMKFRYIDRNGEGKITENYQIILSIINSEETNSEPLLFNSSGSHIEPILLGGSGTLGAGVYAWRRFQSADTEANDQGSPDTDTAAESTPETPTKDETANPSHLQKQAAKAISSAEGAAADAEFKTARDSYEEAIGYLKDAIAEATDPDIKSELQDTLAETQAALKTVTNRHKQQDSVATSLEAAERSFKEAIVRYVAGNQTVARIRFRQARDAFADVRQTTSDTDVDVFTQPITVRVDEEATIQSTAFDELGVFDESTLEALSAAGITSLSELNAPSDELQPEVVTDLETTDEISKKEVVLLTLLSWWYEGSKREFASETVVSRRYEQAAYGYDQSV